MTQDNTQEFDIDALLEGTLDDLADMPEFKPFPAGTHRIEISLEEKKVGKDKCVEAKLKGIETIELPAGSTEEPLVKGHETSLLFNLTNEFGQANLKMVLAAIKASFPEAKTNRELIVACKNFQVLAITNLRSNKEKTKNYTNLVEIAVES